MLANLFVKQRQFSEPLFSSEKSIKKAFIKRMKHIKYLLVLFAAITLQMQKVFAQTASMVVNPAIICENQQAQLVASVAGLSPGITPTRYDFFLNGTLIGQKNTTQLSTDFPTLPLLGGVYSASATIQLSNSSTVTSPVTTFNVYHLPVPLPVSGTPLTQCFRGNNLCFINNSSQNPNTPSNPIDLYFWNWGDATGDTTYNNGVTCHKYSFAGTFTVFLRAVDNKGCRKDTILTDAVRVNQNNQIDFEWTMLSGPCFSSCYKFKNRSAAPRHKAKGYRWDFGDGQFYSNTTQNDSFSYDTITHCYYTRGPFNPKLAVTDLTDCTDSLRKTFSNTSRPLPDNIVYDLDITTFKRDSTLGKDADTVCVQSFSSTEICFKVTPMTFLAPGTGDFVWDFGDPNDPTMRNEDSSAFSVCHAFSAMGTFFPKLIIKRVCPGVIPYYSAIVTKSRFDSILTPTGFRPADNDWGPNPYGVPPNQVVNPQDTTYTMLLDRVKGRQDSVILVRSAGLEKYFLPEIRDTIYLYRDTLGRLVYVSKVPPVTLLSDTIKLSRSFFVELTFQPFTRKLIHNGDSLYPFKGRYSKPIVWFNKTELIKDTTLKGRGGIIDILFLYTPILDSINKRAYGVEVIGPFARIEKTSPPPVLLKPWQKNQCGPDYTVDFVNTSMTFKSRKLWMRWDFDDDYAPKCTSFSDPKPGYFPVIAPPAAPRFVFLNAVEQDRNSDHYFIHNKQVFPGKVNCKFSHDSLPRHSYTNWDSVYNWYLTGKDWQTEATSGGLKYWDPVNNRISNVQGTYYGQPWARVDNLPQPGQFWPDQIQVDQQINVRNLPDPFAHLRGDYVILNGGQIRAFPNPGPNSITYNKDGKTYTVASGDMLPGSTMTFHKYAFHRIVQRCLTVRLRMADTLNNESGNPYRAKGLDANNLIVDDSLSIDNFDCNGEGTVQLALGKATAYGLAKGGKECPGDLTTGLGARIDLSLAGIGNYPGVTPNCGQTHILLNIDSLADRKDNTPCVIDGFTGYRGGVTPGGLIRPNFNTCPNAAPRPGCPWTNARGTSMVWHFGYNAGPASSFNFPPPADTIGGWITVGLQIGCGCKENTVSMPRNNFLQNAATITTTPIYQVSTDPFIVGMPANPAPPAPQSPPSTFDPAQPQFVVYNFTYGDTIPQANGTHLDVKYFDCNHSNNKTNTVWYHNFLRILNLEAQFDVFPASQPVIPRYSSITPFQPGTCRYRGKGDEITVLYLDSIMDSIAYSIWDWGDATQTVDSFWYDGSGITNSFYENGIRRVRYNFDCFGGNCVLMDSTVFPIRASGVGAINGLKPRTPGLFTNVYYDLLDWCTGAPKANPPFYIADTSLMFLPITHKFLRTSWEATGSNDKSEWNSIVHLIVTKQNCQQFFAIPVIVGVIDTFFIREASGREDTVFCANEEIFFDDSVRYWRYDCAKSNCNNPPGPGRTISRDIRPLGLTTDPNYGYDAVAVKDVLLMPGYGCNFLIDTADFWRFEDGKLPEVKGTFPNPMFRYNRNGTVVPLPGLPAGDAYDVTLRVDTTRRERLYWDFGDGSPIYEGVSPKHKYLNYGRYAVTMYTRDSLGFWDTCVRWVNIVKPVVKMEFAKKVFNCAEIFSVMDSSYLLTGGQTLDGIANNYWWFGENKIDTITPQGVNIFKPKKATWPYRSNGEFLVKLKVVTTQGCADSAYEKIFIKGPRPRFKLLSDTLGCAPMRIRLWNLADSLDKQDESDTPTVETIIYWGDAGSNPTSVLGRRDTVEHVYQDSGVFQILAVGRDTKFPAPAVCRLTLFPDTATDPLTGQLMNMPIKIYVKKFKNELSPDDTIICVGNEAEFTNTSDNAFNKFVYKRFKDSDLSEIDSITRNQAPPDVVKFRFDSVGRFQIHSIPRGFDPSQIPLGAEKNCEVRDTSYISVVKPTPAFDTIRQDMNSAKYLMKNNTNASFQNSDVFEWTLYKVGEPTPYILKDGEIKGGANPKMGNLSDMDFEVDFKNDTGDFKICLKAWHIEPPADCADTVCKIISNRFLTRIKIPNVFTPNNDGSNDNFVIDIEGEDKYDLQIFNRWGNKVFESKDSKKTWNGKDMNDGGECPAGVYYFIFNYQLRAQDPATATGTVTLIK